MKWMIRPDENQLFFLIEKKGLEKKGYLFLDPIKRESKIRISKKKFVAKKEKWKVGKFGFLFWQIG